MGQKYYPATVENNPASVIWMFESLRKLMPSKTKYIGLEEARELVVDIVSI